MFVTAYRNRYCEFVVTINDASGDPVVIDTAGDVDVVRLKIGRDLATPSLDLDSAAASANGSAVTPRNQSSYPGQVTVAIQAADLGSNIMPGAMDIEVGIVDATNDAFKHAEKGTFMLLRTQLGDTGNS